MICYSYDKGNRIPEWLENSELASKLRCALVQYSISTANFPQLIQLEVMGT